MAPDDDRRWWRPAWYELVPELLLVAGLTWFLSDEPNAATSAFKSDRAVALMATAGVAWIAGRSVLARVLPWRRARAALFGVAAVGVLAVVVLPAYDDETVIEAFPLAPAEPALTSTPPSPPSSPSSTTVAPATAPSTPAESAPAPPPTTVTTPPTIPTEPVRLRTAMFTGIDHRAAGTVAIYRTPDGRQVVGLEDFDIQPGPDYDVYVVPGAGQEATGGGTRLDDLRGNQGTQYYDVPATLDVATGEWTVLIWCQTFGVPVANATPV